MFLSQRKSSITGMGVSGRSFKSGGKGVRPILEASSYVNFQFSILNFLDTMRGLVFLTRLREYVILKPVYFEDSF